MKKIGLLIAGAFLLTACDASPGRNHDILPVVHDQPVEPVEHHETHEEAMDSTQHENADSAQMHQNETMSEPKDSAH
jgi:hypothetical protein